MLRLEYLIRLDINTIVYVLYPVHACIHSVYIIIHLYHLYILKEYCRSYNEIT
jgi:hypothetical protein